MRTQARVVVSLGLSILWVFLVGSLALMRADDIARFSLPEWGAFLAGVLAPPGLLWLLVSVSLRRNTLELQLAELARGQENLALQVRLLLSAASRTRVGEHPKELSVQGASGEHRIDVREDEEVGPEFILRTAEIVDEWVEVEFRNVGGPASNIIAITEGDTQTRVSPETVGSWKSVRVSLEPVNSADDAFRFCLNFDNARGEEQQQFFRYTRGAVESIERPSAT